MRIFNRLFPFYQKNHLPILATAVVFFITWHKVLNQMFLGEGYIYFDPWFNFFKKGGLANLRNSDNFARLIFDIFPPIFRDNVQTYLLLELTIAVTFFILFYTVLASITKSKLISFTATIFLSVNYVALFEYLANGNYQRFVQRFPNLIPLIISLYCLWKFYSEKKIKYLITSLLFFTISVLMAHFSTFFLPLFIFFTIFQMWENKITLKILFTRFLICLAFILISLYLTKNSEQQPTYNMIGFFSQEKNIIERVVLQIPIITIPHNLMNYFEKELPRPTPFPNMTLKLFLVPCLIIYLGGAILVIKRLPKLKALYFTSLFSMLAVTFLYMYVDTRINIQIPPFGENRYYLPSSVFAVIMWALILKALFLRKKITYLIVSLIILIVFVIYNTSVSWKHIDSIQYQSEMFKRFISYLKNDSDACKKGSVIVTPSYLMWPGPMITQYTCPGTTFFIPSEDGWEEELWINKNNVFVFDYNYEREVGKDLNPKKGKVLDLTQKYRAGEKIIFLN